MNQSKIITQQPKTIENLNIVVIESVPMEHRKTSQKLSKAVGKMEKISKISETGKNSDSPLYSETKKLKFSWMKKMQKTPEKFSHL